MLKVIVWNFSKGSKGKSKLYDIVERLGGCKRCGKKKMERVDFHFKNIEYVSNGVFVYGQMKKLERRLMCQMRSLYNFKTLLKNSGIRA